MPDRERFRICEVPQGRALLPHHGLADAITSDQTFTARTVAVANAARNVAQYWQDRWEHSIERQASPDRIFLLLQRVCSHMDNLSGYAHRPLPFVLRYLRQRLASHVVILTAVVAAVACSVGTQYGVKYLVDGLSAGPAHAGGVWLAFIFLMSLIAADNFLWRIASWTASFTFVGVTGDLAPRHLSSSDRPCAELFLRPAAGHADQPHYRDLQCRLHRREHVRLERVAAVHRDRCGDCPDRHREPG